MKLFAKTSKLRIKLVENPLIDTHTSKDNWIEIDSINDINKLDYVEGGELKEITENIVSKMESLELSIDNKTKKVIKEKIKSYILYYPKI